MDRNWDIKFLLFGIAVINFSGIFYLHNTLVGANEAGLSLAKIGLFVGVLICTAATAYTGGEI